MVSGSGLNPGLPEDPSRDPDQTPPKLEAADLRHVERERKSTERIDTHRAIKRRRCAMLVCDGVHEKGHGSAMDMARRNCVRQTSESDVGMLDMILITLTQLAVTVIHAKTIKP